MRNFYFMEVIPLKENMRACSICGSLHPLEELTEFDDHYLCRDCLHTETTLCERCGERVWADDNAGDGNTPLCQRCYDNYYTSCVVCGRIIHNDDAYYIDEDDYDARCYTCHCRCGSRTIHDYYYKPEPDFLGQGNRWFGVELEIDDAGESNTNAAKIEEVANCGEERIYCKHDGSLNEGFEIVTHPMTMDYHMNNMPWSVVLNRAKEMGYLSHQAGTCGLHIHVNRTAFGKTEVEQDEVVARILYFFEKNWEELLKFSRRTHKQLKQWATRYGLKEHPKDILKCAKGDRERYTCVNLTNYHTIEFRIFRGTLKLNTLLATLQLIDRICDVALYLSDEELKDMSWSTFVAGCTQPELIQYLKERRLYINEPVVAEAEV